MLPAALITFREVIEASLIVATILGILTKLRHNHAIKTVWLATAAATAISLLLLGVGSSLGLKVQQLYTGKVGATIEGILLFVSAIFITWAVFFLHKYFASHKVQLLQKVQHTIARQEQQGIFLLVFTAVLREGVEVVLFLTTIYFSSNPHNIFLGTSLGIVAALTVSFGLFTASLKLPVYLAFRTTSILLILFAAGLLAQGIQEFAELGLLPQLSQVTLVFLPPTSSFFGELIQAIFGLTQRMDLLQLGAYSSYIVVMSWKVLLNLLPRNKRAVGN